MSQVQFAPAVSDDIRLAQKMLISGEWVGALSGRTLPVYDPADGRMIVEVPDGDAADVARAVAAARAAFAPNGPWRSMTPQERGKLIWGRETCRGTLEEYLETKTVVVSL